MTEENKKKILELIELYSDAQYNHESEQRSYAISANPDITQKALDKTYFELVNYVENCNDD